MSEHMYWAKEGSEKVGKEIYDRVEQYYDGIKTEGYFGLLQRSYNAYYGIQGQNNSTGKLFLSSAVTRGGEQGETYDLKVNIYRNILNHMLVLVTSERPAYESMAVNTDYKSQSQADLADGLLEYFVTEKRSDRSMVQACEYALFLGAGHVSVTWDTQRGRAYGVDPNTGTTRFEGDLVYQAHTPIDIGLDPSCVNAKDADWKWMRRWVNRWDLIEEAPELEDEIKGIETRDTDLESWNFSNRLQGEESDLIAVFDWYHKKSAALPEGRMVSILPGGYVLFDGPLPYQEIPIYTIMPAVMTDTPYGYTPGFDMLSVQEGLDILYSSMLTNAAAFGTTNIGVPKGHDLRIQSLGGGLNVIEFDPNLGPPEPINFAGFPNTLFDLTALMEKTMEKLGGINSIVRGDPEGALRGSSGAAMALLASQAIQFSYGLQREYEYLHEDVGTATIKTLQQYADTKRVAMIAGKTKRSELKEFTGQDIANVDRVVVKRASAISKTTAGKAKIAEDLIKNSMIQNADQYINVLKTGNLEVMTERPRTKYLNIKRENELMREGKRVPVLVTDIHADHIAEHASVLDDPAARFDPKIFNIVAEHIEQHKMAWGSTHPNILAATGQQPAPMPMAPGQGAPPQPGGQPPGPGPGGPPPQASGVQQTQGQLRDGEKPSLPNMPNLPQGAPSQTQNAYEQIQGGPNA